jgi:D-alanyl-lipoteichoic acid acyltransferase DltB (MBOAT superfamily)
MPIATAGVHPRPFLGLVITMFLGGLWHGASWVHITWGLYQGTLLIGTYLVRSQVPSRWKESPPRWLVPIQILVTFFCILVGYILFRSPNFGVVLSSLRSFFFASGKPALFTYEQSLSLLLSLVVLIGIHSLDYLVINKKIMMRAFVLWPSMVICYVVAILCSTGDKVFLYFQF